MLFFSLVISFTRFGYFCCREDLSRTLATPLGSASLHVGEAQGRQAGARGISISSLSHFIDNSGFGRGPVL